MTVVSRSWIIAFDVLHPQESGALFSRSLDVYNCLFRLIIAANEVAAPAIRASKWGLRFAAFRSSGVAMPNTGFPLSSMRALL